MKSVGIIGSYGQLGQDLVKTFDERGWKVIPITHNQLQVESPDSINRELKDLKLDWVINTAAFHKVDECEQNPEKAWLINAIGPLNIARVSSELGINVGFISSDYVFSGNIPLGKFYNESDPVAPINVYGNSKAAGEVATLLGEHNIVFRIASVFGIAGSSGKGGNFVESIIKKARLGEEIKVVDDIFMSPTYSRHAANKIEVSVNSSFSGTIHATNFGFTSWYEFAVKILRQINLRAEVIPIKSDSSATPKRPKNTALEKSKFSNFFNEEFSWVEGLNQYLIEKKYII